MAKAPATKQRAIEYETVVANGNSYMYPVLTPKMHSFAEQLIPCKLNLTQALLSSQYNIGKTSAPKYASRLWAREDIRQWLSVRLEQIKDALPDDESIEINEIRIIQELCSIAYTTIGDLASWTSESINIMSSEDIAPQHMASIKKVKFKVFETTDENGRPTSRRTEIELEQHAKMPALEMLAKLHYNWYENTKKGEEEEKSKRGYIVVPQPAGRQ